MDKIMKPAQMATSIMVGVWSAAFNSPAQSLPFLTNGLVAYYRLNGNAKDASGNSNDGVLGSSVTFVPDRFGYTNGAAAFFGDPGSYVALNTTNLNLESNLTVSVWVNFTTAYGNNGPRVFGTSGYELTLDAPDNNYALTNRFVQFAGAGPTAANIYAGQWTHIAGVICDTNSQIYINGALVAKGSVAEPINWLLVRDGKTAGGKCQKTHVF